MKYFIEKIQIEQSKSIAKFGNQENTLPEWMSILMEEVGELSKESVEIYWADKYPEIMTPDKSKLLAELIQVSSVCYSIYNQYFKENDKN